MTTAPRQSTHPSPVLKAYFDRRETALRLFHPQWTFTNQDIEECDDLLKRDLTPICMPPSWDLIHKYAGPLDPEADGYDQDRYQTHKQNYTGDVGEAEFLELMRNTKCGGILIGDFNMQHVVWEKELTTSKKFKPYAGKDDSNIENDKKEVPDDYHVLPYQLLKPLKKVGPCQIDFIYIHPTKGFYMIEVKYAKQDFGDLKERIDDAVKQIKQHEKKFREIFKIFRKIIGYSEAVQWQQYFAGSISYFNLVFEDAVQAYQQRHTLLPAYAMLCGVDAARQFFLQQTDGTKNVKNLFDEEIYRRFTVFLIAHRPYSFISPVICVLEIRANLLNQKIVPRNFYSKETTDIHNTAKTVQDFLKSLNGLRHTNIKFGEYQNVYLTQEQTNAIGRIDDKRCFQPARQIIFGPPGSGKSLILLIKLFIIGQLECRRERVLLYFSASRHSQLIQQFIEENRAAFCGGKTIIDLNTVTNKIWIATYRNADLLFDEAREVQKWQHFVTKNKKPNDEDQIVAAIFTGRRGMAFSRYVADMNKAFDPDHLQQMFHISELNCIFRSTLQIQNYFQAHSETRFSSGHNFDGVKIERYHFAGAEQLQKMLRLRLAKMFAVEQCAQEKVAFFWNVDQKRNVDKMTKKSLGKMMAESRENKLMRTSDFLADVIRQQHPNMACFFSWKEMKSLEFPVMIAVLDTMNSAYFLMSRAVCHLIVFEKKKHEM